MRSLVQKNADLVLQHMQVSYQIACQPVCRHVRTQNVPGWLAKAATRDMCRMLTPATCEGKGHPKALLLWPSLIPYSSRTTPTDWNLGSIAEASWEGWKWEAEATWGEDCSVEVPWVCCREKVEPSQIASFIGNVIFYHFLWNSSCCSKEMFNYWPNTFFENIFLL